MMAEVHPNTERDTDDLTLGELIHNGNGHFADLKFGTLSRLGKKRKVVVKMNKVNAKQADKLLLAEKMEFAEMIPPHTNILAVIDTVPPPQGPMILLEYCELGRMSDWLKSIVEMDDSVRELMEDFCKQVASGMSHLHQCDVLHRRLGARNVLLTRNHLTFLAKLAGFGPIKEEQDYFDCSKKGDRIPLRWLAPEQLVKAPHAERVYSKQSDVWSYGVLLWEMFSKGQKPYPRLGDDDIKRQVTGGYRMDKPPACPDALFDRVVSCCWAGDPDVRPTFEVILTVLEMFLCDRDVMEDVLQLNLGQNLHFS